MKESRRKDKEGWSLYNVFFRIIKVVLAGLFCFKDSIIIHSWVSQNFQISLKTCDAQSWAA